MIKPAVLFTFLMSFVLCRAQDVSLPADLRQHALTQYNASLFNPTFSLDKNNPQSVAFWTRWQWQDVDADPTTLFLNYTRSLNEKSVAGAGFFQHNTGVYFNTGAALNYAYEIKFNRLIKLSIGANIFGFKQEIADTRFTTTTIPGINQTAPTDDFILQLAPGFNLTVENFSMSLASENLFDYNFTDKGANTETSDKIFMGMASYDFPVMASDSTAYLRPSIYLRTIPEQENQIGMNALFSTQKYWAQLGYNNFYGISAGVGGTVFNRFSLGVLVEFGTSSSLNSKDPSFEIVASYFLGKPENRRDLVASGIDAINEEVILAQDITIEQMREELRKAEALANEKTEEKDILVANDAEEKDLTEPELNKDDKKELRRLAAEQKTIDKQQRKDSIAILKKEKQALVLQEKQEEKQAKIAKKNADEASKLELELAEEKIAQTKQIVKDSLDVVSKQAKELVLEQKRKKDKLDKETKTALLAKAEKAKEKQRIEDAKEREKKEEAIAEAKKRSDVLEQQKKEKAIVAAKKLVDERKADSLNKVVSLQELSAEQKEEITEVNNEEVKPLAGEKYEEVLDEDGLEPGFYLIANVFGTKKYFDAFMIQMKNKGVTAKSFYRSRNKYNYAYLEKFNTIGEARRARDSNYNGKYSGKTWIFRVVVE